MSAYTDAINLATLVAPGYRDSRDMEAWTVHMLCAQTGYETTRDFLEAYQRRFGLIMKKQIEYADEWYEEMKE